MSLTDTKEVRFDMPTEYVVVLDAMAILDGMERAPFLRKQLVSMVNDFLKKRTMANRMLDGNPLVVELERREGGA